MIGVLNSTLNHSEAIYHFHSIQPQILPQLIHLGAFINFTELLSLNDKGHYEQNYYNFFHF